MRINKKHAAVVLMTMFFAVSCWNKKQEAIEDISRPVKVKILENSDISLGYTASGVIKGIEEIPYTATSDGKVTVVKRKNSKYCEYDVDIDNTNLAYVQRLFQDIDSVPCLFIGNSDMEELIVYGFYSDFKSTISFPTVSKCTLRVEGLI